MNGTRRTASTIALLISLGGLALTVLPTAFASPIAATLTWLPNPVTTGGTTTGTFGVFQDADCAVGDTFTGTLTVTTPSSATYTTTRTGIACGTTNLTAIFGTGFNPEGGNTNVCGLYSGEWKGTTSTLVGGVHPTFDVTNNFVVNGCNNPVPEFGAPALLVGALGLVLLATVKRGRLLKV